MTVEYSHNNYTLIWSDGDIQDGVGGWIILDKWGNPLIHATTNGVPPTKEDAEAIIDATLKALGNAFDKALLFNKVRRVPIKGNALDFEWKLEENK